VRVCYNCHNQKTQVQTEEKDDSFIENMNRKEAASLAKKNKIIGKNHTKGSFA
jgi:hypothetical protein